MSRIELGRVALEARDISDLLTLYGIADAAEREAFLEMVGQADEPGWWRRYSDAMPGGASATRRQKILGGMHPPKLWAMLDESVPRRPIGARVVMRDQLDRLLGGTARCGVRRLGRQDEIELYGRAVDRLTVDALTPDESRRLPARVLTDV